MKKIKTPKPTEKVLSPKLETVSATPNDPKDLVAHDASKGKGLHATTEDMPGASVCGGDTCHEQFTPAPGALSMRKRMNKPEGGSHTTSPTEAPLPHPHKAQDPHKVAMFSRKGEDRIAHPTTSPRDWNNDDLSVPNTKAV